MSADFMSESNARRFDENGRLVREVLAEKHCGITLEEISSLVRADTYSFLVAGHLAPIVLELLIGRCAISYKCGAPYIQGDATNYIDLSGNHIECCAKWVASIKTDAWVRGFAMKVLLRFTTVKEIHEVRKRYLLNRFLHESSLDAACMYWCILEHKGTEIETLKEIVGMSEYPSVSSEQKEILKKLYDCLDGHQGLKGLGRETQLVQAVSKGIESLIKKNLVRKNTINSRNVHYHLTQYGRQFTSNILAGELTRKKIQEEVRTKKLIESNSTNWT